MESKHVRLLDCTLRDGGHLNKGKFGKEVIRGIIDKLVSAHVDIIELGFLWESECEEGVARFHAIKDVKKILPVDKKSSKFALMADFIDLSDLEPYDGTIDYIRLSFKRQRLGWALKTGRILKEKGYKIFINPVNCNVYTDEQYLNVIKQVNELKPYAFSIVDTFGVMRLRDLTYRYSIVEKNLDSDITIGLHLHENLGLAYSLAQEFIKLAHPKRNIVIDGSLLGMGRAPGNLCIEQIMDHLNGEYRDDYELESVFDAIDDYIAPIKKCIAWGYSIPFALSAKHNLHRTYGEFLMNKWKLRTSDIERILSGVSKSEAEFFSEDYIEKMYREYLSVPCDDDDDLAEFKNIINDRNVLLLAPGASINENKSKLQRYIEEENPVVICIHCVPSFVQADYIFFTNIKRYDAFKAEADASKLILTSNLTRYDDCNDIRFVFRYSRLAYHDGDYCEDSTLMMLNLLKEMPFKSIAVAGFDGLYNGEYGFYIETLSRHDRSESYSATIKRMFETHYRRLKIRFLTQSYYEE